jgi:hypothetical protein
LQNQLGHQLALQYRENILGYKTQPELGHTKLFSEFRYSQKLLKCRIRQIQIVLNQFWNTFLGALKLTGYFQPLLGLKVGSD